MIVPVVPAAIAILGLAAYWRRSSQKHGVMTPERTKIFNAAIAGGMQDPDNLDKLADTFSSEGLNEQAQLLRQRAALKRLPNEVKLARRQVWRAAIKSKNKQGVLKVAEAYDMQGCTSAAMRLREIASGLPDALPEPEATISGEETPAEQQPEETQAEQPGQEEPAPEEPQAVQ